MDEKLQEGNLEKEERKKKKRKRQDKVENQSQEQEERDTQESEERERQQQDEQEMEEQEEIDSELLTITQGSKTYHRSHVEKRTYFKLWGDDNGCDRSQNINHSNEVNGISLDLETENVNSEVENNEHQLTDSSFGLINFSLNDRNKNSSISSRQDSENSENSSLVHFLIESETHNNEQTYSHRLPRTSRRSAFEKSRTQLIPELPHHFPSGLMEDFENQDATVRCDETDVLTPMGRRGEFETPDRHHIAETPNDSPEDIGHQGDTFQEDQADQGDTVQKDSADQEEEVQEDQADQEEEVQEKRSKSIIRYLISFNFFINQS